MKKISVIVPCHNSSEYVYQAWTSLKNQTIGIDNLECIFIDDASTDGGRTLSVLQKIKAEEPQSVVVISLEKNQRQGGARNAGMKMMTGKYMLFLDSDDLYRPEACKELYETAEEYHADIVQFEHEIVIGDFQSDYFPVRNEDQKDIEFYDFQKEPEARKMFLCGLMGPFGCTNKLYRTDLIRRADCSFAQDKVYEEPKFVYPLFLYIDHILLTKKKIYIWRKRAGSTMNSELGNRLLDHPIVQLELLLDLQRRENYSTYLEEIGFHFYYSFFFETLQFTIVNRSDKLTLEFFEYIQKVMNAEFPDIGENQYVRVMESTEYKGIIDCLKMRFHSQKELYDCLYRIFGDADHSPFF